MHRKWKEAPAAARPWCEEREEGREKKTILRFLHFRFFFHQRQRNEKQNLRTVPAFVGELESLKRLDLSGNELQIYATLDVLIKGCPRLREVKLFEMSNTPESRAHLEAFKAKRPAKNPNAKVRYD